jgi:hypothetical protein
MTKVTIISDAAKINHVSYPKGTVMEIPDDLVSPWIQTGVCTVGEEVPNVAPPIEIDTSVSMGAGVPKRKKVDA